MARRRECNEVLDVLADAGIRGQVHEGRKHMKIRWEMGGRPFSYSCAKSPSDRRAVLNCRARVRRILRNGGWHESCQQ